MRAYIPSIPSHQGREQSWELVLLWVCYATRVIFDVAVGLVCLTSPKLQPVLNPFRIDKGLHNNTVRQRRYRFIFFRGYNYRTKSPPGQQPTKGDDIDGIIDCKYGL